MKPVNDIHPMNICIITFPISKSGNIPLSNLIDILQPLSNNLYLLTGNEGYKFFKNDEKIYIYGVYHQTGENIITRILKYIIVQIKIAHILFNLRKKVNLYIFFIGGDGLILPMMIIKLLRGKVISVPADYTVSIEKDLPSRLLNILIHINRILSNIIILHSQNLISEWRMEQYKNKILIAHEYFLDFNKFKIKNKYDERSNLIGFIGRLSEEKGAMNFIKAIPLITKVRKDIKFMIGGEGNLRNMMEKFLIKEKLDNVNLVGWIPHDELPDYLNRLRLLVIPSYIESGPIIALEAMACGTPILSTKVGHVMNMVDDCYSGFIMKNNSPECISNTIIRALDNPNLEEIANNAFLLVNREFSYEKAVEKYNKALESSLIGLN